MNITWQKFGKRQSNPEPLDDMRVSFTNREGKLIDTLVIALGANGGYGYLRLPLNMGYWIYEQFMKSGILYLIRAEFTRFGLERLLHLNHVEGEVIFLSVYREESPHWQDLGMYNSRRLYIALRDLKPENVPGLETLLEKIETAQFAGGTNDS